MGADDVYLCVQVGVPMWTISPRGPAEIHSSVLVLSKRRRPWRISTTRGSTPSTASCQICRWSSTGNIGNWGKSLASLGIAIVEEMLCCACRVSDLGFCASKDISRANTESQNALECLSTFVKLGIQLLEDCLAAVSIFSVAPEYPCVDHFPGSTVVLWYKNASNA